MSSAVPTLKVLVDIVSTWSSLPSHLLAQRHLLIILVQLQLPLPGALETGPAFWPEVVLPPFIPNPQDMYSFPPTPYPKYAKNVDSPWCVCNLIFY